MKYQRRILPGLFAWGLVLAMLLGNAGLGAVAQSVGPARSPGSSLLQQAPAQGNSPDLPSTVRRKTKSRKTKSAVSPPPSKLPSAPSSVDPSLRRLGNPSAGRPNRSSSTTIPVQPSQGALPHPSKAAESSDRASASETAIVGLPAQPPPADAKYLPDDFMEQLNGDRSSLINWREGRGSGSSSTAANASEIRGVWMTTSDMATLRDQQALGRALKQLARLNFNTIYPVVWTRGYVTYSSDVAKAAGIPQRSRGLQGQDLLADLTKQAHALGLSVIPWFEYGFMVPPQSELALLHPDWLSQQRNGQRQKLSSGKAMAWLNPFRPEVQELLRDLAVDLVSHYDVDGIQFDDHMSLPKAFGYDDWTRSRYQSETGREAPSARAARFGFGKTRTSWTQWRADQITYAMADLHRAVKRIQPGLIFSISPNRYDFAYRNHLQDWKAWVERGIVDELIVQAYRRNQRDFVADLRQPEIRQAKSRIPTGIGILTGLSDRRISMNQIQQQVRAAQSEGLGVSFFFYQSLWDNAPESIAERKSGFRSIFPKAVPRIAARL